MAEVEQAMALVAGMRVVSSDAPPMMLLGLKVSKACDHHTKLV